MKLKSLLVNFCVLVVSIGFALGLAEFVSRLVLNPADFLRLEVVKDDVLGAAPSPSAMTEFDRWGFRNRKVPDTVDIVAVGDSHTYGNTARMVDSWPYVLGRLTGRQVYNMALGGYGPNQYFYLSKTKALSLKPRMIIWGLYLGDDFDNAFSITYGLDYWTYLRKLPPQKVEPNIWEAPHGEATWTKRARVWLSRHCVIYQLAFHTGFGGRLKGEVQIRNAAQLYPGFATSLNIPEKNILEAFRPKGVLLGLDQENPNVREGMRITFELLREMNEICRQNHIQFLVVVIPTKEMVFSEYLENNKNLPLDDVIDKLIVDERSALAQTFTFMNENNISYVDCLPAMKKSVTQGLYASSAGDMHPNKNGYRVIAEMVSEHIKENETRKQLAKAPSAW
jgi:hypothetical protein